MFRLCIVEVLTRKIVTGVRIPCRPVCNICFCRRGSDSSQSSAHALRLPSISPPSIPFGPLSMDSFFVNALVRASLCKMHSSSHSLAGFGGGGVGTGVVEGGGGGGGYQRNCPPSRLLAASRRGYHRDTAEPEPRPPYRQTLKSELKSFVDPYRDPYHDPAPKTRPEHDEKVKDIDIAARPPQAEGRRRPPWLRPSTPEDGAALGDFLGCLENPDTSLEQLFQLYQKLPSPQIPHLTIDNIDLFVGRMMAVPLRNETNMLQYLNVLGDKNAAGLRISRNEWNAAISFIARSSREVTMREAKSAIQIWKESELVAGIASNTGSFNILLDMAMRSDAPVLTEWILREMETRGIKPDRFTHTIIITMHGFHGDGEKVREAYSNFVDAGEIVDTVVLNAVMAALIRSGQPQSAEYIYDNMKRATLDPPDIRPVAGPEDWQGKRVWAKELRKIAKRRRIIEGYMGQFSASMAPDVYTFNMFILQCSKKGDYDRAQVLLGEMHQFAVDLDDSISIALLKGFDWHGGKLYSPWTQEGLDAVIKQVFEASPEIIMGSTLAIFILKAVAKVYNSKKKVLEAWDIVKRRWERQGGLVDEAAVQVLGELVGRRVVSGKVGVEEEKG